MYFRKFFRQIEIPRRRILSNLEEMLYRGAISRLDGEHVWDCI